MKTIEVDDYIYDELVRVKRDIGIAGTKPPGVPYYADASLVLALCMSAYWIHKKTKLLVNKL